jgi:hydroxysqualene synthase
MTDAAELRSGKGHRDENFPVASLLIRAEHRAPILAFYEFVRTADDIADHPTLQPGEKLAHLGALEARRWHSACVLSSRSGNCPPAMPRIC